MPHTLGRQNSMKFPGLLSTIIAIICIIAFALTDSIGFMFAAVLFAISAAEARILAVIRGAA